MRELYLLGCLVLGTGAVFATMSVVKYDYKETKQIPKDISYITPYEEEQEETQIVSRSADVIYARNAFDEDRGKEIAQTDEEEDEPVEDKGTYSFELRGINIIGKKKVALLTAQPIRSSRTSSRSSRSTGRTSTPVTSRSSKVHIVAEGEEIEDSGHKVKLIEAGKVVVTNSSGKELPPLFFSLASEESIKRAELAYKNELSRQKAFANQNKFPAATKPAVTVKKPTTTPSTKPTDPKNMTKEQREAEMRKRAENLKAEMKRLKDLRDQDKKSKDKDKKDRK